MTKRIFFIWSVISFCLGCFLGTVVSDYSGFIFLFSVSVFIVAFFVLKQECRKMSFLFLICAIGCFYPFIYESFSLKTAYLNELDSFSVIGRIVSYPLDYGRVTRADIKLADRTILPVSVVGYEKLNYGYLIKASCESRGRGNNFFCREAEILQKECRGAMCYFFSIRKKLSENLQKNLSPSSSALALGILFGDRSAFSENFNRNLKITGTTHIVALSGFNITVIISFIGALFFFLPIKWRPFITIAGIYLFTFVVGPSASIVRAAVMGSAAVASKYAGRILDIRGLISFSALAMVLHNPFIIAYDYGFILSFSALFGIIFLAPKLKEKLFKTKEVGFIKSVSVECFAAGIAVLPATMILFGSLNWLSFIPNIMIIWTVPIAMFFSFISAALALISGFAAFPFLIIAEAVLSYEIAIINFFAHMFQYISF